MADPGLRSAGADIDLYLELCVPAGPVALGELYFDEVDRRTGKICKTRVRSGPRGSQFAWALKAPLASLSQLPEKIQQKLFKLVPRE